jgi:hypothetical protein
MSPPEVWGPAVWMLFHSLIERLNPLAYEQVIDSMFRIIVRICKFLPCPDCSEDATKFLARINLRDYKTKVEFKNMLYLFHNWVNVKKRKPLYNYSHLDKYSKINIIHVLNNFISKYNTKGNMKLLNESFQRSFVVKELLSWFKMYASAFVHKTVIVPSPDHAILEQIKEISIFNDKTLKTVEEEPCAVEEEPCVDEEDPCAVEEEHCVDEEKPCAVEEEPCVDEEKPCVDEEKPCVDEKKPCVDEKKPCAVEEELCVVEDNLSNSIQSLKKKKKNKSKNKDL